MDRFFDEVIKMKEAGFNPNEIINFFLLFIIIVLVSFVLNRITKALSEIVSSITILTYQNKDKYKNDEETEKFLDKLFEGHANKKWIYACDLMDENGFASEERRAIVKDNLASEYDTITRQEKEEMNEYLLTFGNKILRDVGSNFYKDYLKIREDFLGKIYVIIFSGSKRVVKKREFYSLCRGYLVQIKENLKK